MKTTPQAAPHGASALGLVAVFAAIYAINYMTGYR